MAEFKLNKLPIKARQCHLFPAMKDKVLISLGKLCDHNMEVHLTKQDITITEENNPNSIILTGKRSSTNGMWYIDLNDKNTDDICIENNLLVNSVYELRKQKNIINFLAKVMQNSIPDAWMQAIKAGFFTTWPGLTKKLVRKYYTRTIETEEGHMKARRKILDLQNKRFMK